MTCSSFHLAEVLPEQLTFFVAASEIETAAFT
jgi:hypothetical protein